MTSINLLARSEVLAAAASASPGEEWREMKNDPAIAVSTARRIFSFRQDSILVPTPKVGPGNPVVSLSRGNIRTPWSIVIETFYDGTSDGLVPFLIRCSPTFRSLQEDSEVWKAVVGQNMYAISCKERVFSVRADRLLKPNVDSVGYLTFPF
jgi:hypothetical protein